MKNQAKKTESLPASWIQWDQFFNKYGRVLLIAIVGIAAGLVVFSRLSASRRAESEQDYFEAEHYFSTLVTQGPQDTVTFSSDSLSQLQRIIDQHPDLHAKYDGAIAQLLLSLGRDEDAKAYLVSAQSRINPQELSQPYHAFASVTLQIANREYEEALAQSLQLQEQLAAQDSLQTLAAFNLLRIASLYQQLGRTQEELQTWKQWKTQAAQRKEYSQLLNLLQQGQLSLDQYITARVTILSH